MSIYTKENCDVAGTQFIIKKIVMWLELKQNYIVIDQYKKENCDMVGTYGNHFDD